MDTDEKVRENRVRRRLKRLECRLFKSRVRDPRRLEYGGYLVQDDCNRVVFGGAYHFYSASLQDVEEWLDTLEEENR